MKSIKFLILSISAVILFTGCRTPLNQQAQNSIILFTQAAVQPVLANNPQLRPEFTKVADDLQFLTTAGSVVTSQDITNVLAELNIKQLNIIYTLLVKNQNLNAVASAIQIGIENALDSTVIKTNSNIIVTNSVVPNPPSVTTPLITVISTVPQTEVSPVVVESKSNITKIK